MFDFMLLLSFLKGNFVHDVNTYCALLFVDYTMNTGEPISVVKLRVSLLTLWFVVLVLYLGKTENHELSCWKKKKV